MKKDRGTPLLVFAHVPPPEHGQSRMVATMLEALEDGPGVIHVDARYSDEMADVGSGRFGKLFMVLRYLRQALAARWRGGARVLYYVPGPAIWTAVLRDWMVLAVLRPWFPDLVLHWHAIGQGEWAHGGGRTRLPGPGILDRLARKVSAMMLRRPALSIVVSSRSDADARAVASRRTEVVCNGIDDPCPDYERDVAPMRSRRAVDLRDSEGPEIRVLFMSHGTEEKGLIDALEAVQSVAARLDGRGRISMNFAGGVEADLRERFSGEVERINADSGLPLIVKTCGFVIGEEKARCFVEADMFLAASRWESFGLTVVEAMAWGVPVVAAASDGVRGVLKDDYAWLAPPGDAGKLADQLERGLGGLLRGEGSGWGGSLRRRFETEYRSEIFRSRIQQVLADHCGTGDRDA